MTTMADYKTEPRKASELKTGDIVHTWQLRVRVNEVKSAPAYGQEEDLKREGHPPLVFWTVGTVLNLEEAKEAGFPVSWCGSDGDGNPTWQVQSNDRSTWAVEV
ncbi:hypothetical protein SEA_JAYCOOKIE_35 [Arthrobacter phage JayCookie]|uniref:Uncharacterized protein n=3 Tax=Klausavirus princesstrina TaxID=1984784 RepID=A0A1I9SCL1_9CAUD|nr:hypothetical protein SEA_CHUBSTER_35 [Arthrobacter phage Chubster]ASX99043.1 hypothetical protein SEA_SCAVITO_35 [Arthrobacter phage Scavito]ASZ73246.1 hypothetical protein SEA_JAYCOOKIE_35 [Arthrobacter phage JayCookie]